MSLEDAGVDGNPFARGDQHVHPGLDVATALYDRLPSPRMTIAPRGASLRQPEHRGSRPSRMTWSSVRPINRKKSKETDASK